MPPRACYFQCVGGASGDMILGALVACGLPVDSLRSVVSALGLTGVELTAESSRRQGAFGTHLTVRAPDGPSRSIDEFVDIVESSSLPDRVISSTVSILRAIGGAEARVHGADGGTPHLDELGSADTLVDVTCAVAGLAELGVGSIYSSPLPTGSGVVETAHGMTPVPAPATLALLAKSRAQTSPPPAGSVHAGEMVTPTGAAIITTLATFRQPHMTIEDAGFGLGTRDVEGHPNALGLWIGRESAPAEQMVVVETNIDDDTPEILAHALEGLTALGVRDAWLTPARLKKGRAGWLLGALCDPALEQRAAELILGETSTLGVRVARVSRHEADREQVVVSTSMGSVPVKIKRVRGEVVDAAPEYEAARRIALETRTPLRKVMEIARRAALDGPQVGAGD